MNEKEISALKNKIKQKKVTPKELLEILQNLNSSFSELNNELKYLKVLNDLKKTK